MTHDELKNVLIEYHHAIKDVTLEEYDAKTERYMQAYSRLRAAAAELAEEDAQDVRRVVGLP